MDVPKIIIRVDDLEKKRSDLVHIYWDIKPEDEMFYIYRELLEESVKLELPEVSVIIVNFETNYKVNLLKNILDQHDIEYFIRYI